MSDVTKKTVGANLSEYATQRADTVKNHPFLSMGELLTIAAAALFIGLVALKTSMFYLGGRLCGFPKSELKEMLARRKKQREVKRLNATDNGESDNNISKL